MRVDRPPAIKLPAHVPIATGSRYFARAVGQEFAATNVAGVVHIDLYDEIGPHGVSAKDFRAELRRAASADILLRINSPGGDVFDGLAIFADLVEHPGKVRVEIAGIAASAASLIAMAGDEIAMAPRSFLMIHNSHALSIGDARIHADVADVLKQIDGSMADTYAARSGMNVRAVKAWMDSETWLTGAEAIEAGLATEVTALADDPKARFDLSVYAKAPAELLAAFASSTVNPNAISNRRDYETFLRDAGMSRTRAKAFSAGYRSTEQRDADSADLIELAAHISAQANFIEAFKDKLREPRSYQSVR